MPRAAHLSCCFTPYHVPRSALAPLNQLQPFIQHGSPRRPVCEYRLSSVSLPAAVCIRLARPMAVNLLLIPAPRSSPQSATGSGSLRPSSANRISSNPNQLLSPSDLVGPSPVTSNGTETTEIEDEAADDLLSPQDGDPTQHHEVRSPTCSIPQI